MGTSSSRRATTLPDRSLLAYVTDEETWLLTLPHVRKLTPRCLNASATRTKLRRLTHCVELLLLLSMLRRRGQRK